MKKFRILIIAFILLMAGAFFWLTAGTDAQTLLFERIVLTDRRIVYLLILLSALTLLSTLSGLPILYLSMAMGFLLNFTPALLICWSVNVLAVMSTFIMVRSAFTGYFREKYGEKKMIRRINAGIGKYGIWTIVFSRAVYVIPTNIINFSFPLSSIRTRSYLLGTMLGLIPECLINVLTGYLIKHEVILLSTPDSFSWHVAIIGAFILFLLMVFFLLRQRKKSKAAGRIPFGS